MGLERCWVKQKKYLKSSKNFFIHLDFILVYMYLAEALALLKEVSINVHATDKKDRYILMATLMATCFADKLFDRM